MSFLWLAQLGDDVEGEWGKEEQRDKKRVREGGKAYSNPVLGPFLPWPYVNRGGVDVWYMTGYELFRESSGVAWTTYLASPVGTVILAVCNQTP